MAFTSKRRDDMKIVRVQTQDGPDWGLIKNDEVFHLPDGPFGSLRGGDSLGFLDDLELLAPAEPTKIVCVGRNYAAHAAEHGADVPNEPLLFLKPPSSVSGPGAEIVLPGLSSQVEHECELAIVIGKRCREIAEQDAWNHVLGITCGNDVTARDLQRADLQWTRGKGFDTFCPLGPGIVTGLGEQEVSRLDVSCTVNGDVRQHANTEMMVFSPSFLIAYITQVMTLEPGDVIMTGTPSGVSPLQRGDEVTVEVEGVGKLTNPVVSIRN
jgi:2-keto-4-pentenoate hydratase/2-oxohepta-3-ene-1,7-dioic acid hydratase in catechol pathway